MNMARIIVLAIVAIVVVAVIAGLGAHGNAAISGLIVGVAAAIGIVFFILSNPAPAQVASAVRWIVIPLLIVALPIFLLSVWSPAVKTSVDRWSGNQKQTLANKIDKKSLKSEPESGIIGTLASNTWAYDGDKNPVWELRKGAEVMALSLSDENSAASKDSEGMTLVMLRNKNGDFAKGNIVLVPSRRINWNGG